jgi:hypothetical protein
LVALAVVGARLDQIALPSRDLRDGRCDRRYDER